MLRDWFSRLTGAPVTAILGIASLVAWRWIRQQQRRSLLPAPDVAYPPHLSSWIPFLGSAIAMTQGPTRDWILQHAQRFQSPIFTAWVAGTKCVFLADSDLVFSIVFKDSLKQIDSLSLQKKVMRTIPGLSHSQVATIMEDDKFLKANMAQFHRYLVSSDAPSHLEQTIAEAQQILGQNLQDAMAKLKESDQSTSTTTYYRTSMFDFVRRAIYVASVGPLISKGLLMEEEHMEDWSIFDRGFPLLFAELPSLFTRKTRRARDKLVSVLSHPDTAEHFSPWMKARRALHADNFSDQVIAKFNLMVMVAALSNSIPGVFWTLYNVLSDPIAYQACRDAVEAVAAKEPGRDYFTLAELDELMILQSAFLESLRLYQVFFIVRDVIDNLVVKDPQSDRRYMLEKGTRIMALPNTVHMDPEIFHEPEKFRYDRFLDPTAKSLTGGLLSNYLRPFGGGVHLCPGRKFIGYETRAFLALLFLKLDMQLAPTTTSQPPGILMQRRVVEFDVRLRSGAE